MNAIRNVAARLDRVGEHLEEIAKSLDMPHVSDEPRQKAIAYAKSAYRFLTATVRYLHKYLEGNHASPESSSQNGQEGIPPHASTQCP